MKTSIERLAGAIREIHAAEPQRAEEAMEVFLSDELRELDHEEKVKVVRMLEEVFTTPNPAAAGVLGGDLMERLVPLLLGRDVDAGAIGGPELVSRLAAALNTVFSALNELIAVINSTLGGSPGGDETIRQIIGSTLGDEKTGMSIEEYLDRIRKAFLAAQQASREAARTVAGYIMTELDPATMEPRSGGLKIGPLKKAEAFELFTEKYARVKKWYDSERFLLDFLRQFEKNCQKSFT
ncbi:MAG TPA: hypothetical protein PK350_01935 [Deltaproteobacteria bacterium]|nr:hypothetical protein [Deltaproteobacteria bacterium]